MSDETDQIRRLACLAGGAFLAVRGARRGSVGGAVMMVGGVGLMIAGLTTKLDRPVYSPPVNRLPGTSPAKPVSASFMRSTTPVKSEHQTGQRSRRHK